MTTSVIWAIAATTYALFWCWYVGFKRKITPRAVEETMRLFDAHEFVTPQQLEHLRRFLANDDGFL